MLDGSEEDEFVEQQTITGTASAGALIRQWGQLRPAQLVCNGFVSTYRRTFSLRSRRAS